jgi:hypothetical protein
MNFYPKSKIDYRKDIKFKMFNQYADYLASRSISVGNRQINEAIHYYSIINSLEGKRFKLKLMTLNPFFKIRLLLIGKLSKYYRVYERLISIMEYYDRKINRLKIIAKNNHKQGYLLHLNINSEILN